MATSSSASKKSADMPSGSSTPTFIPVHPASIAGDQVSTSVLIDVGFVDSFFVEMPSFPAYETIIRSIIRQTWIDDDDFNAAT